MENTTMSFSDVETAIAEVQQSRNALVEKIETARSERDELLAAPLCRSDVISSIESGIDADREHLARELRNAITNIASRPSRKGPFPVYNYLDRSKITTMLLADLLKERFATALADIPEPEHCGPPLAKRSKRLAELEKTLDQAEAELLALRQNARRAGVQLRGAPL